MDFDDVIGDGVPLAIGGLVNQVGVVLALHGQVGGDFHDLQAVDAEELVGLGGGGTGHAGQLAYIRK